MLLTITYTGENTENLGFLLHKNPYRAQCFELSYGNAYVFYPEISNERTTAALLMDINPIDLARGKLGSKSGGLFDYVNDRPYVSSSFMSTTIARVFGTALAGKCSKMQELADTQLDLTACVHMLPCRAEENFINEIFEPLGYEISYKKYVLDEKFPEWGDSAYIDLTIKAKETLASLLNHLYVLIPVFDRQKHYWTGKDEIEKLLRHGEGWLANHPYRNMIINRYFPKRRALANRTIRQIIETAASEEEDEFDCETGTVIGTGAETEAGTETGTGIETGMELETEIEDVQKDVPENAAEEQPKHVPLNRTRLETVRDVVVSSNAMSVLDLGCGDGKLTAMLLKEKQIERILAADVSIQALEYAKNNLHLDRMPPTQRDKLELVQASLIYKDKRFSGFDAACIVEVIEHLEQQRLSSLERVVFEYASPKMVVVTTPNKSYNVNYEGIKEGSMRHSDHRFEWTRPQFSEWVQHVCETFSYTAEIRGIGDVDEENGCPTQMGVFTKCV